MKILKLVLKRIMPV